MFCHILAVDSYSWLFKYHYSLIHFSSVIGAVPRCIIHNTLIISWFSSAFIYLVRIVNCWNHYDITKNYNISYFKYHFTVCTESQLLILWVMIVEVISPKIIPIMYYNFRRAFSCKICLLLFVVVWLILHVFSFYLQNLLPLILSYCQIHHFLQMSREWNDLPFHCDLPNSDKCSLICEK